jgi:hypothetical protein
MRLALRRSRRAVRHDDQPLAHLPQLGSDQRQQPVQRVHVPRRHGLQPGQHQPDEVPPETARSTSSGSRRPAAVVFIAQEILVDPRQLSDDPIAETAICSARSGLGYSNLGSLIMSSGVPYDSTRARAVRGDHGLAARHGQPDQRELAAVVGALRRLRRQRDPMLGVMQMHRDAVEQINDACPTPT